MSCNFLSLLYGRAFIISRGNGIPNHIHGGKKGRSEGREQEGREGERKKKASKQAEEYIHVSSF